MIKKLDEVNIEWITQILNKRFNITHQDIKEIIIKNNRKTPISEVAKIEIIYNYRNVKLPSSLFIKISKSDLPPELSGIGKREVDFYKNIAPKLDKNNILDCYYSNYDKKNKIFNLVFEDLSETYYNTEWPLPPSINNCYKVIDCLAKIHARWWGHSDLNKIEKIPNKLKCQKDSKQFFKNNVKKFIKFMDDRLSDKGKEIIYFCQKNYYIFINRITNHRNITLIHKDSHFWNFLLPKKNNDFIKIIDWQIYGVGLGARDLSYMIALHWYPSRRKKHEIELLKRYYKVLLDNGVKNFSFDDLLFDYKLSMFDIFFVPIWQWSVKLGAWLWWPHLERVILAFEDLNCWDIINKESVYN